MDATGTAAWLAQQGLLHLGGVAPWVLQLCVALFTRLFAQVMSNVGATVMMVPVAISVAVATGADPAAYALIVAVSSSKTSLISAGHPALMMVTGPGGYKGKDFLRVGAPLTVLMLVATLLMVDLMFRSEPGFGIRDSEMRQASAAGSRQTVPSTTRSSTARSDWPRQGPPVHRPSALLYTAPCTAQIRVSFLSRNLPGA
ncbi:hypothetical protein RLIN73S_01759 [Rhodanobacter lindaniclasticus]